jgi:hypothetical protein
VDRQIPLDRTINAGFFEHCVTGSIGGATDE